MTKSNSSRRGGDKIYMDYSASVSPNPSSIHGFGVIAKKKLQNARAEVAEILGARASEIIFTSGGTESNNLAIQGVVLAWHEKNSSKVLPHIVTTNIEHPSVLETCKLLEKRKLAQTTVVPVEANGIIDPKKIKKEIKSNTILISVMYANNEIGTIQPIKEIAKEIRHYRRMKAESFSNGLAGVGDPENRGPEKNFLASRGYPMFHTDAVQASNYLDLNVERLGVDLLTLSGSKIEGAGRVGVLYKRKSTPLVNVFGGGDQEQGLRPGTENLSEILKFATALKSVQDIKGKETKRLIKLRDYFIKKLFKAKNKNQNFRAGLAGVGLESAYKTDSKGNRGPEKISDFCFLLNGDLKNRLPNNINITISKIPSDLLVIELSARGIMASSKSACKSSRVEGSYVIKALRKESDLEIGGVRFSLGRQTTKADIDYTVKALSKILTKLKRWYN